MKNPFEQKFEKPTPEETERLLEKIMARES